VHPAVGRDGRAAVFSIGKRCLEMGYAFYWPPFSERPFFVKPDGSRVTMEVEGNIPYRGGREVDNACPAEGADGPDVDAEHDEDVEDMPCGPTAGRIIWETPHRALSSSQRNVSVGSGGDAVQDSSPADDERPPMTLREMCPHVDDLGMTPSVVVLPTMPALRRVNAAGSDVPIEIDDPNATPDESESNADSDGPAPLIDSDSEDVGIPPNRYGIDSDEEPDDDGAVIVVQDDVAPEDEDFERVPAGIVAPDVHLREYDVVEDGGDIDAVYSRDFVDVAADAFTLRHLATHKPKLKSRATCQRAEALRAKHAKTKSQGSVFPNPLVQHPRTSETKSHWTISLPGTLEILDFEDKPQPSQWWIELQALSGEGRKCRKQEPPTWRRCNGFRGLTPKICLVRRRPRDYLRHQQAWNSGEP
jgi:hypothetical protein